METKSEILRKEFKSGNIKAALKVFKTFRMSLDKESRRIIEIAYECLTGKEKFYQSLGIDIVQIHLSAIDLLKQWANR